MKNEKYEIILKYENKKGLIRILGEEFVKRNKDNCKMIYNGEEKELSSYVLNEESNEENYIEIKIKIYKDINNMSGMFYNCKSLKCLPDISKWNTINVDNMSAMFYNCESLKCLPDISKWNTINLIDINFFFYNCSLLSHLPDISKWNTNKIWNLTGLFSNCKSLLQIPDISNWKIGNQNKEYNNFHYFDFYKNKFI